MNKLIQPKLHQKCEPQKHEEKGCFAENENLKLRYYSFSNLWEKTSLGSTKNMHLLIGSQPATQHPISMWEIKKNLKHLHIRSGIKKECNLRFITSGMILKMSEGVGKKAINSRFDWSSRLLKYNVNIWTNHSWV